MEILNLVNAVALSGLSNNIIQQWVGPLVLAGIAVFAIIFLKDRAWMKLISFVGIAAIVAVLVYAGPALFGSGGTLTKTGTDLAKQVNGSGAP
jgi:hypothetical protein